MCKKYGRMRRTTAIIESQKALEVVFTNTVETHKLLAIENVTITGGSPAAGEGRGDDKNGGCIKS